MTVRMGCARGGRIVCRRQTALRVLLKVGALALGLWRIAAAHAGAIIFGVGIRVGAAVQLALAARLSGLAEALGKWIVVNLQLCNTIVLQNTRSKQTFG